MYKLSQLNLEYLIKNSNNNSIFKRNIRDRKSELGKIFYKGYKINNVRFNGKKRIVIKFYFEVQSKQYERGKRKKYIQILEVPLFEKMEDPKFGVLYNKIPVKIFSSDESFKYFLCFALNKKNAVVIDNYTRNHLGIALTKFPKIRNKKLSVELNKHFYKLLEFLKTKKLNYYYNKKYLLKKNSY